MRNLDPNRMFAEMANRHLPRYRFEGCTQTDFIAWHAEALPAVLACLGDFPETVPPNPELLVEWCERGVKMQRWVIDVQHGRMAADFVQTLPEVDGSRLGVLGLSGGGTATTWSYLCDDRFCGAEITCYCDQWAAFGMRDVDYCGMLELELHANEHGWGGNRSLAFFNKYLGKDDVR